MTKPIWEDFLTERDKAVFAQAGYGARGGFGKKPALLIIDVNYNFCSDRPEPILESIKRFPQFLRRGCLGGTARHQEVDRCGARQKDAGTVFHRRSA